MTLRDVSCVSGCHHRLRVVGNVLDGYVHHVFRPHVIRGLECAGVELERPRLLVLLQTTMTMSEIDQKAEHLIKSYKTTDHEDYTRAILLALFTHPATDLKSEAPTPEGRAYIRGEVLKHDGDPIGMKKVADSILRKLLLPDTPETVEWNPGDQWLPTYASHVIPLSATTKSGSWQLLERFAGFRLDELQGHKISSIQNIITLSYDIHVAFCRFLVWFELDKTQSVRLKAFQVLQMAQYYG
ncbi:hypothetical protein FRC10_000031 [Ceratobasidium sp. 414]|nr:hypothetical protein FRC10_000031 [Ceratobasidium sp. 414]